MPWILQRLIYVYPFSPGNYFEKRNPLLSYILYYIYGGISQASFGLPLPNIMMSMSWISSLSSPVPFTCLIVLILILPDSTACTHPAPFLLPALNLIWPLRECTRDRWINPPDCVVTKQSNWPTFINRNISPPISDVLNSLMPNKKDYSYFCPINSICPHWLLPSFTKIGGRLSCFFAGSNKISGSNPFMEPAQTLSKHKSGSLFACKIGRAHV